MVTWDRIAQARRSLAAVFITYLMPMVLITVSVEGWGLYHWGKWQTQFQKLKDFPANTVITYEAIQTLLLVGMVLVSALVLLRIAQTFGGRCSYLQTFKLIAYGFSPLFLVRLLDAGPSVPPAATWALGVLLTIWILYQGVPRVLLPDPAHAFGMYLSSIIVVTLTSGLVRVMTALYLLGYVDFHNSWLTHKFPGLFQ